MILLDTSGLLAALDSSQRQLDDLLSQHVGAQRALLEEVARGAYQLEAFGPADVKAASEVTHRFASLKIGLADASIVILGRRHGARDVLTLDERHFRALRIGERKAFRLLPAALHG